MFLRTCDKNFLGYKSEAISVRFLFSIVIYLSTISQNLLESHDFTIPLRSNGNQALALGLFRDLVFHDNSRPPQLSRCDIPPNTVRFWLASEDQISEGKVFWLSTLNSTDIP